ncbi:hypothetical protein [Nostoc sp. FACHB-888]|jgi:hypothetical protein|uniref:hypothetical protein n=1 Tax=Nostoc sp. FACHB-888 TaxID=2692842 RepID=UPI0016831682|nr:hypothetical protein [Nostoc sp. FACHB-888]MBD2248202.1 hypothetical protein [Nostoc sp. FACHB-888]
MQEQTIKTEQIDSVVEAIKKRIQKASELATECDSDAKKSSKYKRTGRWMNTTLGLLATLIGIAIAQIPEDAPPSYRINLGLFSAIAGSAVTTAGQLVDPARARQRAISLQTLKLQLENFSEETNILFLGLQESKELDKNKLMELNSTTRDKFTKLHDEALKFGVYV